MKILAIETSCDETGLTIFEAKGKNKFTILANSLSSQVKIHAQYGGVFPAMAKREHQKNLPILFEKTLKKSGLEKKKKPFDLIVVTSGPGLEPALWTGIVFAKELGEKYGIPVLPVNHMEGHILSVFAKSKGSFVIPKIKFPTISLLVSGGHTEIILMEDWLKYEVIGETLDDAAGEAYDKVARMLELPYPGGPEISKLAEAERKLLIKGLASSAERARGIFQQKNIRTLNEQFPPESIYLPRPMIHSKNFNFSFSGLKTAVLYLIRDLKNANIKVDDALKQKIACEFENAVVETLVFKTKKAIEKYVAKTLIVAGGVSANKHLKKETQKMLKEINSKTTLLFPDKKLTGDNSVMIGVAGYLEYLENKTSKTGDIKAEGNLRLK
jgi:N6-L-threonylcarbamoyladenine synthase